MNVEDITYEKLDELRLYLHKCRKRLYTCTWEHKKLVEANCRYKNELTGELKLKQFKMLQDKEQREKYGITNQNDWKQKIDQLTEDIKEENSGKILTMNHEEEAMVEDMARLRLTISDTEWELQIAVAYYTGMNGSITRPLTAIKGGI